ncbi:unnamed protein product [Didymodactylos carnosus]|uniref:Uncharacterized protein n=1 Tax=Didymodactylos carnosus TaxID=1234261 RepID=A0A814PAK0_9BILA|nr:unnamed protein product [Didymodactylos carnosus]CAF1476043.1 unnamed protein product [Didymodactylos carnosus]CAF3867489.1 unnamed protein product [Didymodactylos carnosus]CAF4267155.1 unnamed protein product [Didymodactylos carnosus]
MCRGYCRNYVLLTPSKIIAVKESYQTTQYPSIKKELNLTLKEWENILNLVDITKFKATPNVLGCPDCADGGAEWIEIVFQSGTKRVTFDNGRTIPGLESLVNKLREIRNEYIN